MFRTPEGQARYVAAYNATLALWPVPVHSFDIPTRFGSTHVHTCGPQDAPPLVLLPGQAISSTMWYPNIEALSRDYRVYAPDIVGDMGKSIQTRPFKQPRDFADWLNDLFDEMQLEAAHVVGLSFGGFIALRLALATPKRVKKLILMAPASLVPLQPLFFLRMAAMFLPASSLESKQKLLLGVYSPNLAPAIKQMMTSAGFRFSMYLPPVCTDDELRRVTPPTLLLLGDHEVVYSYKAALRRAARLIPHVQTAVIPGASHTLNFDQPEMVSTCIVEFLKREVV